MGQKIWHRDFVLDPATLFTLASGLLLIAVGILTPVTGALLHELSSIPVIANSAHLIGMREQARSGEKHYA